MFLEKNVCSRKKLTDKQDAIHRLIPFGMTVGCAIVQFVAYYFHQAHNYREVMFYRKSVLIF